MENIKILNKSAFYSGFTASKSNSPNIGIPFAMSCTDFSESYRLLKFITCLGDNIFLEIELSFSSAILGCSIICIGSYGISNEEAGNFY